MDFGVIIAGGGAMGSAAAWQLAQRGMRVACFDRFAPPHSLGSSHGATRIIRQAYFEHPLYVPLVKRAFALWDDVASEAAVPALYVVTGGAYVGRPESALARGVLASVTTHALPHQVLSPDELAQRYPALRAESGMIAVVEERAGFLHVEAAIRAMRARAIAAGALFFDDEPVTAFSTEARGVNVVTARGRYDAERLVVAAGAWMSELLPELSHLFTVQRQVTVWCAAISPGASPNEAPVTIWELPDHKTFYTIPDEGDGFKIGVHYGGILTTAATVDRSVAPGEEAHARELLARFIPPAAGRVRKASVCLYTNTPDLHFVIDWLPSASERVLVVSPCSGHGFKFAPAIGEIAADLVTRGTSEFDLTPFKLARFRE